MSPGLLKSLTDAPVWLFFSCERLLLLLLCVTMWSLNVFCSGIPVPPPLPQQPAERSY